MTGLQINLEGQEMNYLKGLETLSDLTDDVLDADAFANGRDIAIRSAWHGSE